MKGYASLQGNAQITATLQCWYMQIIFMLLITTTENVSLLSVGFIGHMFVQKRCNTQSRVGRRLRLSLGRNNIYLSLLIDDRAKLANDCFKMFIDWHCQHEMSAQYSMLSDAIFI